MSNYLFVEYTLNDPILSSTAIPFNNIKSQNGISYNDLTGENRFDEPGTYQVNWWVATQSSTAPNANFVLYHSDNGQTYVDQSCSPAKTGQTSGTAVFQVTDVPHTAYLRNESGQPFYFAQSVPVKASLTAFGIPSQGIALVPFGSIYVDSMVDSEEAVSIWATPPSEVKPIPIISKPSLEHRHGRIYGNAGIFSAKGRRARRHFRRGNDVQRRNGL